MVIVVANYYKNNTIPLSHYYNSRFVHFLETHQKSCPAVLKIFCKSKCLTSCVLLNLIHYHWQGHSHITCMPGTVRRWNYPPPLCIGRPHPHMPTALVLLIHLYSIIFFIISSFVRFTSSCSLRISNWIWSKWLLRIIKHWFCISVAAGLKSSLKWGSSISEWRLENPQQDK